VEGLDEILTQSRFPFCLSKFEREPSLRQTRPAQIHPWKAQDETRQNLTLSSIHIISPNPHPIIDLSRQPLRQDPFNAPKPPSTLKPTENYIFDFCMADTEAPVDFFYYTYKI